MVCGSSAEVCGGTVAVQGQQDIFASKEFLNNQRQWTLEPSILLRTSFKHQAYNYYPKCKLTHPASITRVTNFNSGDLRVQSNNLLKMLILPRTSFKNQAYVHFIYGFRCRHLSKVIRAIIRNLGFATDIYQKSYVQSSET